MTKKKIVKFILFLFIYSLTITGSTYAILTLNAQNNTMTGSGYCNNINYTAEIIDSSSITSTENYLEGAKTNITISNNTNCRIYTLAHIYLYTNESTTSPIEEVPALKYKVFDGEILIKEGTITQKKDTLIATVPLSHISTTYTVYTYIDSSISNGSYNNTNYSGYIYATTEQTSTINGFLVRDSSYNNNNGIATKPTWDQYKTTITTDGIDDYVDCGLANYDFAENISVIVRFKLLSFHETEDNFFNNFQSAGAGIALNTTQQPYFSLHLTNTSSYSVITVSETLKLNEWYTIIGTYDGSIMKIYVNGILKNSKEITGSITPSTAPYHISNNPSPTGPESNYFTNATYSDVMIFNRALTEEEITNNYTNNIDETKVDKTNLLLYYNFQKFHGNKYITDLSTNENNGIIYGTTIDKDTQTLTTDGIDDYVDCGLANYDFGNTVSMVIKFKIPTTPSTGQDLLANFEQAGTGIGVNSVNKLYFQIYTTEYQTLFNTTTLTNNEWYTIVATYDGTIMKIYVNGTLENTLETTGTILPSSVPFHISSNPHASGIGSYFLNATYQNVMLFNRALTEEEITTNYSNEIDQTLVDDTNLLLNYEFK